MNTIPTLRTPDVADGAADIGKGDLTPNDNQMIPERKAAATANKTSQATGGKWLTKSVSSFPAPTPSDARIGSRDKATAISAVEETSARAMQIVALRRRVAVRQIRSRNGRARRFTRKILL